VSKLLTSVTKAALIIFGFLAFSVPSARADSVPSENIPTSQDDIFCSNTENLDQLLNKVGLSGVITDDDKEKIEGFLRGLNPGSVTIDESDNSRSRPSTCKNGSVLSDDFITQEIDKVEPYSQDLSDDARELISDIKTKLSKINEARLSGEWGTDENVSAPYIPDPPTISAKTCTAEQISQFQKRAMSLFSKYQRFGSYTFLFIEQGCAVSFVFQKQSNLRAKLKPAN